MMKSGNCGLGSDEESSDEEPVLKIQRPNEEQVQKKKRSPWEDVLMEQELERVRTVYMEDDERVERGSESFEMPRQKNHLCTRRRQYPNRMESEEAGDLLKPPVPIVTVSPAEDDPFAGTPDISQVETFGTALTVARCRQQKKKRHPVLEKTPSLNSVFSNSNSKKRTGVLEKRTHAQMMEYSHFTRKEYSLDDLIEAEFAEEMPLEILADNIATVLGELEPCSVVKIVKSIGRDRSLAYLEQTKQTELAGGMLVADGSRRKTAGGVFIAIFKDDPTVDPDLKKDLTSDEGREDRKWIKGKRRGRRAATTEVSLLEISMKLREQQAHAMDTEEQENETNSDEEKELQLSPLIRREPLDFDDDLNHTRDF
ncbi:unnamed protein product, partial [Mesorhabditis spiculigera]